jgi:hypothetical protein
VYLFDIQSYALPLFFKGRDREGLKKLKADMNLELFRHPHIHIFCHSVKLIYPLSTVNTTPTSPKAY